MTNIKFCGLTRQEDIDAVNDLLPAYVGFVFAEQSRRRLKILQAAAMKKRLTAAVSAVGVFVDSPPEFVANVASANIIDVIQLHGAEDENYIAELRKLTAKKIIKAFVIKTAADLIPAAESSADCVLLDAGAGAGVSFDWRLVADFPRQFFLAGGLRPENVGRAVEQTRPFAVDVSSGIENDDGFKDYFKMRKFMMEADIDF